MSSSAPFALLPLLAILFCLGGMVWLWVAVFRQPRGVGRARCAQCRYAVEGLQTMSCPECGSDFREVGILPPENRLVKPLVFLLIWTVLLPVPALVVSLLVINKVPRVQTASYVVGLQPVSGAFPELLLQVDYQSRPGRQGMGLGGTMTRTETRGDGDTTTTLSFPSVSGDSPTLTGVRLQKSPTPGSMVIPVPPPAKSAELLRLTPDETGPTPDDEAAIKRWVTALGTPPPAADADGGESTTLRTVDEDIAELADLMGAVIGSKGSYVTKRFKVGGSGTSTNRMRTPTWAFALVISFWVVFYFLGVAIFFFIRKRRRASELLPAVPQPA
ncbi:MAG: hypothetical protein ACYTGC_08005 [Planctomycetota bacterium]|jgi:hypothetical protein